MPCPVCVREVQQPKTGRPRIYCCQAHRKKGYERRHWRPLGHDLIRRMGIEDRSPLAMLNEKRVREAFAVADAMYARRPGR